MNAQPSITALNMWALVVLVFTPIKPAHAAGSLYGAFKMKNIVKITIIKVPFNFYS